MMLITGARVALGPLVAHKADLWIDNGRVSFLPPARHRGPVLDLTDFLILPGLINAHDHLELNLFPRLGHGPYPNAKMWAEDIYHPDNSPLREHLAVPKTDRLCWGALKNLLSGVTTVAHHNTLPSCLCRRNLPIRVVSRYGWAHSVHFSSNWQERFQATPRCFPFIMHAAEGTDELARRDIDVLAAGGALRRSTVLVHGVAIGSKELIRLRKSRTSLVWCPSSNHFTLGRTLSQEVLNSTLRIALGTDSAITAEGDLLDEIQVAHASVTAERLYAMVTYTAACVLKLPQKFGNICEGGPADLLVIPDRGLTPATSLLNATPELVFVRGRIELASLNCSLPVLDSLLETFSLLAVANRGAFFLRYPVTHLLQRTAQILQSQPSLAGKLVAA